MCGGAVLWCAIALDSVRVLISIISNVEVYGEPIL